MLYRRGRIWWLKFEHGGEPVRLSTGVRDKTEAAREARQKRADYEKEHGPGGGQGVTLDVLEELHIQFLRDKGRGDIRIDTVENLWRNLYKHLGGERREVATLTLEAVQSYEGARRKLDGVKGQTIRRETQALVKGLRLAKRDKILARLPFDVGEIEAVESDAPKAEQTSKPRSDKEINKALLALSRKAKRAGYHKMLRFIRVTGLRLEEFRRYERSWLQPTTLAVPTIATKTGRVTQVGRDLPLTKEARAIAKEWGNRFARRKFNHALVLACARAGISPVITPRDIRATAITEWARIDPAAAQYLAGHTSLATTARYVKIRRDEAIRIGRKANTQGRHSRRTHKKKASNS